jgi:hypothetical protein
MPSFVWILAILLINIVCPQAWIAGIRHITVSARPRVNSSRETHKRKLCSSRISAVFCAIGQFPAWGDFEWLNYCGRKTPAILHVRQKNYQQKHKYKYIPISPHRGQTDSVGLCRESVEQIKQGMLREA